VRFLKPSFQGINSVSVGYILTLTNVSHRACLIGHFLGVRVPRDTAASIDVKPVPSNNVIPQTNLSVPLLVRPGKTVGTYVVLTTPCGGIVGSEVGVRIVFYADTSPIEVQRVVATGACRGEDNEIELPPLVNG